MTRWSQNERGTLMEIELREDGLYFEVGPDEWPARGHQGNGGTISFQEFREKPEWFADFPGLWERIASDLQRLGI